MPETVAPFAGDVIATSGVGVAVGVAVSGAEAVAQEKPYPVFTAEHFVAAMKTVGQAFAAVTASIGRKEFEDSKSYLAISRDRLATTICQSRSSAARQPASSAAAT